MATTATVAPLPDVLDPLDRMVRRSLFGKTHTVVFNRAHAPMRRNHSSPLLYCHRTIDRGDFFSGCSDRMYNCSEVAGQCEDCREYQDRDQWFPIDSSSYPLELKDTVYTGSIRSISISAKASILAFVKDSDPTTIHVRRLLDSGRSELLHTLSSQRSIDLLIFDPKRADTLISVENNFQELRSWAVQDKPTSELVYSSTNRISDIKLTMDGEHIVIVASGTVCLFSILLNLMVQQVKLDGEIKVSSSGYVCVQAPLGLQVWLLGSTTRQSETRQQQFSSHSFCAFSPEGSLLATKLGQQHYIWTLQQLESSDSTALEPHVLTPEAGEFIRFTDDGSRIISFTPSYLHITHLHSNNAHTLTSFRVPNCLSLPSQIVLSLDNQFIAIVHDDKVLLARNDASSLQLESILIGLNSNVKQVAFNKQATSVLIHSCDELSMHSISALSNLTQPIVTASPDGLWKVVQSESACTLLPRKDHAGAKVELHGHKLCTFSKDSRLFASVSGQRDICIRSVGQFEPNAKLGCQQDVLHMEFSWDNTHLLVLFDNRVLTFDLSDFRRVYSINRACSAHTISGLGNLVAITNRSAVDIWNLAESSDSMHSVAVHVERLPEGKHSDVQPRAISKPTTIIGIARGTQPSSVCFREVSGHTQLIIGAQQGSIEVWDVSQPESPLLKRHFHFQPDPIMHIQVGLQQGLVFGVATLNRTLYLINADRNAYTALQCNRATVLGSANELFVDYGSGLCEFVTPTLFRQRVLGLLDSLNNVASCRSLSFPRGMCLETTFMLQNKSVDVTWMLVRALESDEGALQTLLQLYPQLRVANTDMDFQFGLLVNALQYVIEQDLTGHAKVILNHVSGQAWHYRDNPRFLRALHLPFVRMIPSLAERMPSFVCLVFESFQLEITGIHHGPNYPLHIDLEGFDALTAVQEHIGQRSPARRTWPHDDKPFVQVVHRASTLPDLVNLEYWRSAKRMAPVGDQDPLAALVENELVSAFEIPIVCSVLALRWARVRKFFFAQLGLYLLFVASASAFSNVIAHDDLEKPLLDVYTGNSYTQAYAVFGILALILACVLLFNELVELRLAGPLRYFSVAWNYFDFAIPNLVITVAVLHVYRHVEQTFIATLAILLIWFKIFSFMRAFRISGIFIRLIFAILFEIRYFLLFWMVLLMGFANAYYIMFRSSTVELHSLSMSFLTTFASAMSSLNLVVRGDEPFPFEDNAALYNLQLILYLVFMLVANILMRSLLVGLMNASNRDVTATANPQYRMEKAKLMLGLEAHFLYRQSQLRRNTWLHLVSPSNDSEWTLPAASLPPVSSSASSNQGSAGMDQWQQKMEASSLTLTKLARDHEDLAKQSQAFADSVNDKLDRLTRQNQELQQQNRELLVLLSRLSLSQD